MLRPSCTSANFLSPKSIASSRQGPLAQLESEALDAQLGTLTTRLRAVGGEALRVVGGEAAGRGECAAQVVKLLAKDVVPEAAERGWVVRAPLALARGSKAEPPPPPPTPPPLSHTLSLSHTHTHTHTHSLTHTLSGEDAR